jgi:hypothetical protein
LLNPLNLSDLAVGNLIRGLLGFECLSPTVVTLRNRFWQSGLLECDCSATVSLDDPMTCVCENCGAFYNGSGQKLCHPKFWGEETGERFDDAGSWIVGTGEEL